MEILLIKDLEILRSLEGEWGELLEQSSPATIFQSPEWIITWAKHFLNGDSLFILIAREEGKLIGLAPLMLSIQKNGIPSKTIRFLGDGLSDYNDFILQEGREEEILDSMFSYLEDHKSDWRLLQLREFSGESLTLKYLNEKVKGSIQVQEEETFRFNTSSESQESQRQLIEMEEKVLQSRGRLKKFMGSENFSYLLAKEWKDFLVYMDLLKRFHVQRWEETSTPSYFKDPVYEHFFDDLHLTLWKKGMVKLSVVRRHDEVIATILCYLFKDRCYYYTSAYSFESRNLSPSHANFISAIKYCVHIGFHSFDFGRGDESFKREYANYSSRNHSVSLSNNMAMVPLLKAKHKFMDKLRDNPSLYRRAKQMKEFFSFMHKTVVS